MLFELGKRIRTEFSEVRGQIKIGRLRESLRDVDQAIVLARQGHDSKPLPLTDYYPKLADRGIDKAERLKELTQKRGELRAELSHLGF